MHHAKHAGQNRDKAFGKQLSQGCSLCICPEIGSGLNKAQYDQHDTGSFDGTTAAEPSVPLQSAAEVRENGYAALVCALVERFINLIPIEKAGLSHGQPLLEDHCRFHADVR